MEITKILRFMKDESIKNVWAAYVKELEWSRNSGKVHGTDRDLWHKLQNAISAHLVDELDNAEPDFMKALGELLARLEEISLRDKHTIDAMAETLQDMAESKGLVVCVGVWDGDVPYVTRLSSSLGDEHIDSLKKSPQFQRVFPFPSNSTLKPMGDD